VTADVAARTGARLAYLERDGPQGPNAARNTGIAAAEAPFFVFVDDDVEAPRTWLRELLRGRERHPGFHVFGGPIRVRLEGSRLRTCGREPPPVTALDAGANDREIDLVWSANMGVEREAFELAGLFDADVQIYGDEERWERRLAANGGRIMYVARAGLFHRRDRHDARLHRLALEAYRRGRNLRAYSEQAGHAPPPARELRVLAGCVYHTFRHRCGNGILMTALSAGRVRTCLSH
jgi:GT2 family glycosyltransferase